MEKKWEIDTILEYVLIVFFAWMVLAFATWIWVDVTYTRAFERGVKSVEQAEKTTPETNETEVKQ